MNRGFVAILMVSFLSFVAATFIALSGMWVWSVSGQISRIQMINSTKYNAISCVSVAQFLLLLEREEILGAYDTGDGGCEIEKASFNSNRIRLVTSSTKNSIKIMFESELDPRTFQLVSLIELNL